MFVDRVLLTIQAGRGGDGAVAWRREKFIRKGGPVGGNGGRGGSIWIEADDQLPSLEHYRNQRILKAQNGQPGGGGLRDGKSGEDLVIKVPVGTLAKNGQTGEVLCDLMQHGQRWRAAAGGKGGRGNASFRNATHRTPYEATPGELGGLLALELELKLIADVGLVGLPNAGKSTLLTSLAGTPAKIGAYPFTTLRPNLGYVLFGSNHLLMADIPGIIDGASQNRGLGLAFLRHIERTRLLIYMIDASGFEGRDPWDDWCVLRQELAAYDRRLLDKPAIIVLNKMDMEDAPLYADSFEQQLGDYGLIEPIPVIRACAAQGEGLQQLVDLLDKMASDVLKPEQPNTEPLPEEQLSLQTAS